MLRLKKVLPILWSIPVLCTTVAVKDEDTLFKVLPMAAHKETNDACSISKHVPTGKWVGMVTTKGCSLSKKQRNLLHMGASGILVESSQESTQDIFLSNNRTFYVVQIGKPLYKMLLNNYLSKNTNNQLNNLPTVSISYPIGRTLPMVQILYVVFLIIVIFVFPVLFERLEDPSLKILSPKELVTLPLQKFSDLPPESIRYESCPICFDQFFSFSMIRNLKCSHYFHTECIDPWLLGRSGRCPVCNHDYHSSCKW
ncbi:hypothetical protein NEFER03_1424 [Nematocida sp. LUAm3]|nr:hypothetical protein NEFER03_1424 [Nematocida sp. LUAm3]KAI5174746.1 hypothetical protein NEFER02_0856 [Nematocida sp. LUAm2]KAI5177843.1 hypothetical protein NEFER01_1045 [Nematocida sp. LUAm1]